MMFRKLNWQAVALMLTGFTHSAAVKADDLVRVFDTAEQVVAVQASRVPLVHTKQLLPQDVVGISVGQQAAQVLAQLEQLLLHLGSGRNQVVKLHVAVRDAQTQAEFAPQLNAWFGKMAPSVTYVVSRSPGSQAVIAIDCVIATNTNTKPITNLGAQPPHVSYHKLDTSLADDGVADMAVLPVGDVVYISGQAEPGEIRQATRATMAGLTRSVEHFGLSRADVVQLKVFLRSMDELDIVRQEIASAFSGQTVPPVVYVEWIANTLPIEIELIAAAASNDSADSVTYLSLPWMSSSPVYSRASRVHRGTQIYIAGITAQSPGDGEQQVREIFTQLKKTLKACGSDLQHLAKATYYVSDEDASTQLNLLRPNYYDPLRPPAASKAVVPSVALPERTIVVDMIAAPAAN